MRKWFKRFKDHQQAKFHSQLARIEKYFQDPNFWKFSHEAVARGVGVGLFVACIPALPFQTLLVVAVAVLIRANIPVAFAVSWVSNPVTIVPLAYLTSVVGGWVLGEKSSPSEIQVLLHSVGVKLDLVSNPSFFARYGKAFFVGLPIVALAAGVLGYVLAIVIWKAYKYLKKS